MCPRFDFASSLPGYDQGTGALKNAPAAPTRNQLRLNTQASTIELATAVQSCAVLVDNDGHALIDD